MKQRYLLLLLIIIALSVGFLYSSSEMMKAKHKNIRKIDKKIKKKQEILNSAKVLNEQLSQVSKVIKNSITDEREFSSAESNAFVKKLADVADHFKMAVINIVPKVSYSAKRFVEQEYTLEVTGTYVQLGRYLSSLESLDRIIKITDIDVRPMKKARDEIVDPNKKAEPRYRIAIQLLTVKIVKES